MESKVIIIGTGRGYSVSESLKKELLDKYGDITILTAEEANEKGIIKSDYPPVSEFILTAPKISPTPFFDKHAAKNECKKGWRRG